MLQSQKITGGPQISEVRSPTAHKITAIGATMDIAQQ
jgi:hypothetical protein